MKLNLFSSTPDALMAVDISSASIKLVELGKTRGGYQLKSMAVAPLPRDVIVENEIIDSTTVTQTLKDVVEIAGTSTKNVAFAVSGNALIIKTVTMPMMTELELEMQIEFEADQHVPYDMEDVYLDFQILGPSEDGIEMDVVLVACKRDVIEAYQQVIHEAGLTVKCVDCAGFAVENAAGILADERHGPSADADAEQPDVCVHALANIGANFINVNIMHGDHMAFVRDQFFGGNQLTQEIQEAHGVSFQVAEQMKLENFSGVDEAAVEHYFTALADELVRTLDFYAVKHADVPVQKVFLSGGGALVPGTVEQIEQRLGIETKLLNPFSEIKAAEKKFDADYIQRVGPMMMVPVGLALRRFD
ncbi:MAG: type IV pilus assembly protein PilM [Mariprofundaceae bacterium]|nr:type IV pilus assembly protein PilM [Mariprofundaceae bacterium]